MTQWQRFAEMRPSPKLRRVGSPLCAILLSIGAAASAQQSSKLDKVTVTGREGQSQAEADGLATSLSASEIKAFGDRSVTALLKRLPGVSIDESAGAAIRLRGLSQSYSRIYVNGEPLPQGTSVDSVPVDVIERIVYLKAPGADFSSQGIAGIINIITSSGFKAFQPEFRIGTPFTPSGYFKPDVSMRISAISDATTQLGIGVGANESVSVREISLNGWSRQEGTTDEAATDRALVDRVRAAYFAGNLIYRGPYGATLRVDPRFSVTKIKSALHDRTVEHLGTGTMLSTDATFLAVVSRRDVALPMTFRWLSASGIRSEVAAQLNHSELETDGVGMERYEPSAAERNKVLTLHRRQSERRLKSQWASDAGEVFNWSSGLDAALTRLNDAQTYRDTGRPVGTDRTDFHLTTRDLAGFIQVRAEASQSVDLTGGVRYENQLLTWQALEQHRARRTFDFVAPSASLSMRSPLPSVDRLVFSLRRSVRYPTGDQLSPRVVYSAQNSVATPDRVGNPALEPETAASLDVAVTGGWLGAKKLQLSAYFKSISNYIGTEVAFTSGAWLGSPINRGQAKAYGIEETGTWQLGALGYFKSLELRTDLAWNSGRATLASGRATKLEGQPRYTAKTALEWSLRNSGFAGGVSLTASGPQEYLDSADRRVVVSARAFADAYFSWAGDGGRRFRVSVTPVLGEHQRASTEISEARSGQGQSRRTEVRPILQVHATMPF